MKSSEIFFLWKWKAKRNNKANKDIFTIKKVVQKNKKKNYWFVYNIKDEIFLINFYFEFILSLFAMIFFFRLSVLRLCCEKEINLLRFVRNEKSLGYLSSLIFERFLWEKVAFVRWCVIRMWRMFAPTSFYDPCSEGCAFEKLFEFRIQRKIWFFFTKLKVVTKIHPGRPFWDKL